MKNIIFDRFILFILGFMIIFSTLTFASGEDIYMNQGIIMKLDLREKVMVVNERMFTWDQATIFLDKRGAQISIENFKPKAWVYIEGVREKNNPIRMEKIYLLPKYVEKKEKHLYPFIK